MSSLALFGGVVLAYAELALTLLSFRMTPFEVECETQIQNETEIAHARVHR